MQKFVLRVVYGALALSLIAGAASAGPVIWTLSGVTLSDGGTASGSFTFNADAGTACSGGTTPCGLFSNVDIVTTTGSARTGATYLDVCGTNVASCTGISPDSTEVMFLTSNAADQTGLPAIAFFFTAAGPLPPAGLTDAGGTIDISNGAVGAVQEASCSNAACVAPVAPSRVSIAGTVAAAPEPATWAFLLAGLGAIGMLGLRRHAAVNASK